MAVIASRLVERNEDAIMKRGTDTVDWAGHDAMEQIAERQWLDEYSDCGVFGGTVGPRPAYDPADTMMADAIADLEARIAALPPSTPEAGLDRFIEQFDSFLDGIASFGDADDLFAVLED
jgi:hypothetical protein